VNHSNKTQLTRLWSLVALLHVAGIGLIFAAAVEGHLLFGIGGLAYLLGLRHAFDVDHIAAIDNMTRKLSHEDRPSVFVGFWFSLGHSTVVLGLCVALIMTLGQAEQGMGMMAAIGGLFGTTISAIFLSLMAIVNGLILARLLARRSSRRSRNPCLAASPPVRQGSALARFMNMRPARHLDAPWKLYPVGLLFGLGFDTATEIAVLGLSVVAIQQGIAATWTILALPMLFAAGMTLMDSINGLIMRRAYRWADTDGQPRLSFNIVMTGLSVALALAVAGLQWLSLATEIYVPGGTVARWLAAQHFEYWGAAVLMLFVSCWLFAFVLYRRSSTPCYGDNR